MAKVDGRTINLYSTSRFDAKKNAYHSIRKNKTHKKGM